MAVGGGRCTKCPTKNIASVSLETPGCILAVLRHRLREDTEATTPVPTSQTALRWKTDKTQEMRLEG